MPQNNQFVKDPPATSLRDSNDALAPLYGGEKSFMTPLQKGWFVHLAKLMTRGKIG